MTPDRWSIAPNAAFRRSSTCGMNLLLATSTPTNSFTGVNWRMAPIRLMKQLSLKEIQDKYAADGSVSPAILRKLQRDPRTGARRLYKILAKRYEDQKKERNRLEAMLHFERLLWKAGIQSI